MSLCGLVLQDDVGWIHVKGYQFCELIFDGKLRGMSLQIFLEGHELLPGGVAVLRCGEGARGGQPVQKHTL